MEYYDVLCSLLRLLDKLTGLLVRQDYYNGMRVNSCFVRQFASLLDSRGVPADLRKLLEELAKAYVAAQESSDYVRMADICRMELKPLLLNETARLNAQGVWREAEDYYEANYALCDKTLRRMLDSINAEDESDIPDSYELVETRTGTFTLRFTCGNKTVLMHGMNNPDDDAQRLAEEYCSGCSKVVLLGFGMGYVANAIVNREDILRADVFEHDKFVLKAAFHYSDLSDLLSSGRAHIHYDPMLREFASFLSDNNSDLIIHHPSMMNIKNTALREKTEEFFLHDSSVRSQSRSLRGNYLMNMQREVVPADKLLPALQGRNVLLVAGGPSLDDDIPYLVQSNAEYFITEYTSRGAAAMPLSELGGGGEYIVMAVGTVLKRLLCEGIVPDYVVMTDAQPNMLNQINGTDTSKLTLIHLPTLYHGVVERWKGKRFVAFQRGYAASEEYAADNGLMLFETGGSVATLALDLCLRLKVSKIVCLGLDLAFPDGRRHAGDGASVCGADAGQENGYRRVMSVDGRMIYTAKNLDSYRAWIERRIERRSSEEKNTELVNASGGAAIAGMVNRRLQQDMGD